MTSTSDAARLLDAALRVGGTTGPQDLQERLRSASPPLDLDTVATRILARASQVESADRVLDAVVGILLKHALPTPSLDAIAGMASLAAAELQLQAHGRPLAETLERELAEGRPLTRTTVWSDFVAAPSWDARRLLALASTRTGASDLLSCASDSARPRREREAAVEFLVKRVNDKRLPPLSRPEEQQLGGVLTALLSGIDQEVIYRQYDSALEVWARCDRAGAEQELVRVFETTGTCGHLLLKAVAGAPLKKADKPAWLARLRRFVETQVTRGFIEPELARLWRRLDQPAADAFLQGLDQARLDLGTRRSLNEILTRRKSVTTVPRRVAQEWQQQRSAAALREIYATSIASLAIGAPFDRWMTLLGAKGIREPFTFRARDVPEVSLFVEVDAQGRLQAVRFEG
jgi:hypothetical protein